MACREEQAAGGIRSRQVCPSPLACIILIFPANIWLVPTSRLDSILTYSQGHAIYRCRNNAFLCIKPSEVYAERSPILRQDWGSPVR